MSSDLFGQNCLFAGSDDGTFLSTNNGSGWISMNPGLLNLDVTSLVVSGMNLFAGTSGGVFLSTNNGISWSAVNTGLTNTEISALTVSSMNLFAATINGVWKRKLSDMVTSAEKLSIDLPVHFSLSQNSPNPFNPSTSLRYSLPFASRVSIKIYNVLGQQVADLLNSEQLAGWYEKTWTASIASGIYFCQIDAVNTADPTKHFVDVKKMILMR